MPNDIYVRSSHISNKKILFENTGDIIPEYDELREWCEESFQHRGYLVFFYDNKFKICLNQKDFDAVSKYLYDNKEIYYVREDCVKISKKC